MMVTPSTITAARKAKSTSTVSSTETAGGTRCRWSQPVTG